MFRLPIDDPQPSQLYVGGEKLAEAVGFDFSDPEYDPLLAREIEGEWVILDGHTRGVLAVFAGEDELRLTEDTDSDHPKLYRECVSWCRTEGITSVSDLVRRIVDHDTYKSEWIDRCHREAERLRE